MRVAQDSLVPAIDELRALAGAADREALAALAGRLQATRLRVLVVGEAKRGKSTLVNALLGRELLPAGVTPLTALATTVTHGRECYLEVAFADGRSERLPLAALEDLGTERGNPANRRAVASITAVVDAPILARGVEIVDTPGTGSVHEHNTAEAGAALRAMDAAVFVLTADPPVSASERELLGRVRHLSVTTFVVLNKADYLDPAGLAEAVEFTARVVGEAAGAAVRVYPVSARAALAGGDAGFAEFRADFTAYLDHKRAGDLRASASGQVRRIAEALLDEVALASRVAQMRGAEAAGRVREFTARLAAVRQRGQDTAAVAAAESARMLAGLNAAAAAQASRLAGELRAGLAALLAGELAEAPAARVEREGGAALAALTAAAVESWRQAERDRLERGLAALDARLGGELAAELASVREAAADLLGLELAVPVPAARLPGDRRFFYTLGEAVDQTELLVGAVRRRMPGQVGRRLAADHLRGRIADLAASQVGRARADLQYRLAEATRELVAAMGQRYAGSTDRLVAALESAAVLREQAAGQGAQRLLGLAERERALRGVLTRLDQA